MDDALCWAAFRVVHVEIALAPFGRSAPALLACSRYTWRGVKTAGRNARLCHAPWAHNALLPKLFATNLPCRDVETFKGARGAEPETRNKIWRSK